MKVDVYRDGRLWLAGQDPARPAIWPRIKEAAIAGHDLRIAPPAAAPRPPRPPSSVFGGVGMFTEDRPQDAAGLSRVTYTLLRDPASPSWLQNPVTDRVRGVVRQAETPDELADALEAGHGTREGALVTNLDPAMIPAGHWPAGWSCLPECYWNADGGRPGVGRTVTNMIGEAQRAIGSAWGTVPVVPVVGCYDASSENPGVGVRLELPDYAPELAAAMRAHPCVVGYAVWRIETCGAATIEALK